MGKYTLLYPFFFSPPSLSQNSGSHAPYLRSSTLSEPSGHFFLISTSKLCFEAEEGVTSLNIHFTNLLQFVATFNPMTEAEALMLGLFLFFVFFLPTKVFLMK